MPRYRSKAWRDFRPGSSGAGASAADAAAPVPSAPRGVASRPLEESCRILGLDPGSRLTGWGVIEVDGSDCRCLAHGRIEVGSLPIAQRLARIHAELGDIIGLWRPTEAAVERVFVGRNVDSALKLGQARGAALAAIGVLEVAEYAPRAVKLATTGFGGAEKLQVAHMMRALLKVEGRLTADAADALAVALCHAQHRRLAGVLQARSIG